MRLLVVMANYPFPPRSGSAIVAYNSMKYLSEQHNIELVSLKSKVSTVNPTEFVERSEILTAIQYSKFTKIIRYLFYMLLGIPPSVSLSASRPMKELVKKKIESNNFDAIFFLK